MVLREYGQPGVDWMRVMEMVAVHDLVEIDAGDVSAYDVAALAAKSVREQAAADRIFGLLPADQQEQFRQLWDEFEAQATPEARFANAVDRLQPLIQNAHSGGGSWCGQTLVRAQILRRMAPIETSLPDVWPHVLDGRRGVLRGRSVEAGLAVLHLRVIARLAHVRGAVREHRKHENHEQSDDDTETDVHPRHGITSTELLSAEILNQKAAPAANYSAFARYGAATPSAKTYTS